MFGCSLVNSAAIFLIVGSLPIQDEKLMVTGSLGSGTGPDPVLSPDPDFSPPPQAVTRRVMATAPMVRVRHRVATTLLIIRELLLRAPSVQVCDAGYIP